MVSSFKVTFINSVNILIEHLLNAGCYKLEIRSDKHLSLFYYDFIMI
jgi:hypothetical protein